MLLAAGLGQRLLPLSLVKPKALFPVLNKTMLYFWLEKFLFHSIKKVVINVHYLSSMLIEAIEELKPKFPFEIIISYEPNILGTGGGIKAAINHFKNPFYVINSDIYTTFDLKKLALFHQFPPWAPATLALCDDHFLATVSLDKRGKILGFRSPEPLANEVEKAHGTGLMVVEPDFIKSLSPGPSDIILDLINYMTLGPPPKGMNIRPAFWRDMGTRFDYFQLNEYLARCKILIADEHLFEGKAEGFVLAQKGVIVEKGATVEDSILWTGAVVRSEAVVKRSVVAGEVKAKEFIKGGDVLDNKVVLDN